MDVTEPSTPEEVVTAVLDDYLDMIGDEDLDTDDLADNITRGLREAGYQLSKD